MDRLLGYYWPGNVRELKNLIERAMIMSAGTTLHIERLEAEETANLQNIRLQDIERNHIKQVLESTGWRISGMKGAARLLDIKVSTLRSRMKKLGIERP
jgi:transcriptional regulator of acetoin/glycerol metabolism